jgi:hypothetical protein
METPVDRSHRSTTDQPPIRGTTTAGALKLARARKRFKINRIDARNDQIFVRSHFPDDLTFSISARSPRFGECAQKSPNDRSQSRIDCRNGRRESGRD